MMLLMIQLKKNKIPLNAPLLVVLTKHNWRYSDRKQDNYITLNILQTPATTT